MLDKEAITQFFQSGGVFYCGNDTSLKLSTLNALKECGMKIGFNPDAFDLNAFRYIFLSGNQVHMKYIKGGSDMVINAEDISERFEFVDDSWCEVFRMPSFETLFCG